MTAFHLLVGLKLHYSKHFLNFMFFAAFIPKGDSKNCIHLWEPASDSTWNIDTNPFVGHTASVEDLQVYIAFVLLPLDTY